MNVEYTRSFDRNFEKLPRAVQTITQGVIGEFLDYYSKKQFPKGLRVHKCGPFVSISVTMNFRIFVSPILGGIRFVFVGNHQDAEDYLKR